MRPLQDPDERCALPDSPCRICSKNPCYAKCILWQAWFAKHWQSIQNSAEEMARKKK